MLPASDPTRCPSLHVVAAEDAPRIETLPDGIRRRHHWIFVSRGLLASCRSAELKALFARELAHIDMGHWHLPRAWTLLHASGAVDATREAWEQISPQVAHDLQQGLEQLRELCRAHAVVTAAAASVAALPEGLGLMATASSGWLGGVEGESRHAAVAELCALVEEPLSTAARLRAALSLVRRSGSLLSQDGAEPGKAQAWAAPLVNTLSARATAAGSAMRGHDAARLLLPAMALGYGRARRLARLPVLLLTLAVKRASELAADRAAARAMGGVEPVVAGLVRLHGSAEQILRVEQGDVRGLIDEARALLAARSGLLRWEVGFAALVEGRADPPLLLRVADLASWAESDESGLRWRRRWR